MIVVNKISPTGTVARYPEVRPGDEIVAIDGHPLRNVDAGTLSALMSTKAPTLTLELRGWRAAAADQDRAEKELAIRLMSEVTKLQSSQGRIGGADTAVPRRVTDLDESDDDDDLGGVEVPDSPPPTPPGEDGGGPTVLEEEPNWEEDDVFPPRGDDVDAEINFDDDDDLDGLLADHPPAEAAPRLPHSALSFSPPSSLGGSTHSSLSDFANNPFAAALSVSPPPRSVDVEPAPVWRGLLQHLERVLDDGGCADEYASLKQSRRGGFGIDYEHTFDATKANGSRNRYTDIGACDASRVQLKSGDDSDYINANHVVLPISSATRRHFILAQGPLERTAADFWRMVWEQKCSGIVMVTGLVEMGRQKCHRYYPDAEGATLAHQEFTVHCSEVQEEEDYVVLFLRLTNTKTNGKPRNLTHMRFKAWPDHGIPDGAAPFLDCLEATQNYTNRDHPLVVHCSAGVGRSGVFATVMAAKEMAENHEVLSRMHAAPHDHSIISLKEITRLARLQRNPYIVQKEIQYEFCYSAFCEVLRRLLADAAAGSPAVGGNGRVSPIADGRASRQSEEEFA